MMEVQKYLKEHGAKALTENYAISVKEAGDLLVLNYNQIESPKTHPLTIECRSLILDKNFNIVSRSFDRFFNLGEALDVAPEIDWSKAVVYDKVDGSLIKIYFDPYSQAWQCATRGTAYAESGVNGFEITFRELVYKALGAEDHYEFHEICNDNLDRNFTYIFEVTSVENRVVKRYEGYALHYLAARNNQTGEYGNQKNKLHALSLGAKEIKSYSFATVQDCLDTVRNLKDLDEGYVVYQDSVPVAKIKSPAYLAVHAIRGEGLSPKRIMQLVLVNEQDEYLTYFPEDKSFFEPYVEAMQELLNDIQVVYDRFEGVEDQKEFAFKVKDYPFSGVLFQARRDKQSNVVHKFHQQSESFKMKVLEAYV